MSGWPIREPLRIPDLARTDRVYGLRCLAALEVYSARPELLPTLSELNEPVPFVVRLAMSRVG